MVTATKSPLINRRKKKVSTKLSFYAEPLTMYPFAVRLLLRHLQRRGEGGKRQRSSPIKQFDSSPLPVNAFLPPSNHFLVHKSLGRNLVDSSSGLILPCGGDRRVAFKCFPAQGPPSRRRTNQCWSPGLRPDCL